VLPARREQRLWSTDVLATVYPVLGIDRNVEFRDKIGRPVKIRSAGRPIREILQPV
jgi:hypothetical protein